MDPQTPSSKATCLPLSDLARELDLDFDQHSFDDGILSSDVDSRREKFGANSLSSGEEKDSIFTKFAEQFKEPLILLLMASAAISLLLSQFDDALSISIAVVIVVTVAVVQEYKSEKSMEELTKLVPQQSTVIRRNKENEQGKERHVLADLVVVGDTVSIKAGDIIPADVRLFEVNNLFIDESALTGESHPVAKDTKTLEPPDESEVEISLADRSNIAFMGTMVTSGKGKGLVVSVGESTEFGQIWSDLKSIDKQRTPLQLKMDTLGKQLSLFSFAIIAFITTVGLIQGRKLATLFNIGVSLAVAAIPEGLPIVVTVTLALGVMTMAKKKAIVKKLPAVEALGATSVICVDKTGTLTSNKMCVTTIFTMADLPQPTTSQDEEEYKITLEGSGAQVQISVPSFKAKKEKDQCFFLAAKHIDKVKNVPVIHSLLTASVLCNDASIAGQKHVGSPTEKALLAMAKHSGFPDLRQDHTRVDEIPFTSETKWMAVTCQSEQSNSQEIFVKGATESVIKMCKKYCNKDSDVNMTSEDRQRILNACFEMSGKALRVLALAKGSSMDTLCFVGLVGIIDPPRPGVKDSIQRFKDGGVRVVMITGDSRETAIAIATELGFYNPKVNTAISPTDLEKSSDSQLQDIVSKATVCYRMTPKYKTKIVTAFQKRGEVVAMTGDGINDAPALKKADIGVCMGQSGTAVSKEAADIVLVDDNFATILSAIEEGKSIFSNIRNFLRFQLTTSVAALSIITISTLFNLPNPLNAMQILFINIIMDGPPAQSLGAEPVDPEIMKKPPRDQKENVITGGMIAAIVAGSLLMVVGTLAVFLKEIRDGVAHKRDTTMAFCTFVLFQMFNAYNCRSEKSIFKLKPTSNMVFIISVALSVAGQLAVVYVPFLQAIFQTESLELQDWILVLAVSSTILVLDEGRKFLIPVSSTSSAALPHKSE